MHRIRCTGATRRVAPALPWVARSAYHSVMESPISARRARSAGVARFTGLTFLLSLALLVGVGPAAAQQPPAASSGDYDAVWITLGADAFAAANRAWPRRAVGAGLPSLAEAQGVVLTRLRRDEVDALADQIHQELRRCGGFRQHATLEAGLAELARVALPRRDVETIPLLIDQPWWVEQVAGAIDEAQILATIGALSTSFNNRYHAHPSGTAAATWIRDLWAGYAAGRPEVTVSLVTHPTTPQPSVILVLPGSTLPDEVVVLGGHLDSTASGSGNPNFLAPGADDNASGIATLSEVVRVALAAGLRPQRSIHVMAYAAEEIGLVGSGDIAADYDAAGVDVVAMLQQDMTDYFGSDEDIALISDYTNATLNAFLVDLLETYQPSLLWTSTACGYGCSDHYSWHSNGYPASFAFEARMGQHNPWIHTTSDTVATLGNSAAHAAKFARLAAAFLVEVGLDGPTALFVDGFESADTSAWSETDP